ncbi:MAG: hypothetical protein GWM90_22605 [Gemmatimonadetes bacterium]|nr:hypothetical protein [Gemmatimonadota bacterium]NIQ57422.1 hypothetical protein [Gemmatimonadota bacterium]NIX46772.1 hypothetical protein [Gemmatimonadota bacterium]NIY11126.1 hypothetical protein [Gemmatimonadota bacterium]
MFRRFRKPKIPPDVAGKLRMAAAVAAEQVLDEHVRSAIEMVEEGGDRAPVERLLRAYARLHYLTDSEARKLRERVLAALGRGRQSVVAELDGPRSPVRRIRSRLKGRVNPELRRWVDRHTARVELTVVDIHVENALGFLRLLESRADVQRGVALYAEIMRLRPTVTELVRLKVLKVLHDKEAGHAELLRPQRGQYPLRVADNKS